MTSEATVQRTACTVAVHLGAHRGTAEAVGRWCDARRDVLADAQVRTRTSDAALRQAVPGFDWRSDRGRAQLRAHLTSPGTTLFSTARILGPAYRHTGGPLHPDAGAGVDALSTALQPLASRVHLSIGDHAGTVVLAWVEAVRQGHLVEFETFAQQVVDPTWVPLVERLVAALGDDRVVVHDATAARPGGAPAATRAVARDVVTALLDDLDVGVRPDDVATDGRTDDFEPAGRDVTHWSQRQTQVALAILPHLRSWDDRAALRDFVTAKIDADGPPAWPVTPALAERLAVQDATDLARLRDIVEVR
ncbi:hypothetical protein ACNHYB_15135 [Isoptericola jiangsuensis]|uniref:hypothetical protein n=1 Tax=Isoptericola jiangsuensis TaxID=548579 RepID=UPI003AAD94D8